MNLVDACSKGPVTSEKNREERRTKPKWMRKISTVDRFYLLKLLWRSQALSLCGLPTWCICSATSDCQCGDLQIRVQRLPAPRVCCLGMCCMCCTYLVNPTKAKQSCFFRFPAVNVKSPGLKPCSAPLFAELQLIRLIRQPLLGLAVGEGMKLLPVLFIG